MNLHGAEFNMVTRIMWDAWTTKLDAACKKGHCFGTVSVPAPIKYRKQICSMT